MSASSTKRPMSVVCLASSFSSSISSGRMRMCCPLMQLCWAILLAALFAQENVLPAFVAWRKQDRRAALVTIVGIEGATPRPLGAQMAVTAEGQSVGYLSGGCRGFASAGAQSAANIAKLPELLGSSATSLAVIGRPYGGCVGSSRITHRGASES